MSANTPTGRFREFPFLFFPILLITFSTCFYLLVEKVLLGRISLQAMEAAVTVAYVCQIFQISCIALAMMAQVCVARWNGAKDWKAIGPGIWQFIWFSFLSMLIVIPVGLAYGNHYLEQTAVKELALPHFHFLLMINFLYPLGTALSCFYIGQGKARFVLLCTIGSQALKIALAYLLIIVLGSQDPAFGLLGAAISTLVAQGGFCLVLLSVFLLPKHAEKYNSRSWHLHPKLFWESIQPGLLRATNRILSVTCWASIAHLMAAKGETHLIILSIGGTLFLFLPFLGDAICQSQTIVVSHLLGAQQYSLLSLSFRSGLLWALLCIALLSIPLILFPLETFAYLFPKIALEPVAIKQVFLGLWTSFAFFTLGFVSISYILAFKDMYFSLLMGVINWFNGYLLMYLAIEKILIEPERFWLVLSLMHGTTALFYFLRARWLCSRALNSAASSPA